MKAELSNSETEVLGKIIVVDDYLENAQGLNLTSLAKQVCSMLSKQKSSHQLNWKISENLTTSSDKELINLMLTHLFNNA